MEPINWFMKVVTQHYFDFNGRARRAEFWWYILVYLIIAIVLNVIDGMVHLNGILGGLFGLALLLPSLGVMVRRLHDTNRSGWWYFIILVPLVGIVLLIIWFAAEGTKGPNTYGPDPKGA
ncbi:MAG TPA: DUF805 domain-containing protein [Rhizomicrobium sp.]|jgi:uncharacterized membrane protein YhaH (DUF805 family)|nr:DUF805 domain-containing protein [Rhizomicrobium sp.]